MTQYQKNKQLTDLVLEVFQLNGQFLQAGDRLTRPFGLTSARWQVMGAVYLAGQPLTVAQIGRRMGLSRQAVQRIANDLEKLGFCSFAPNPDHARAKLVLLTDKGQDTLTTLNRAQEQWVTELGKGLDEKAISNALTLLRQVGHNNMTIEKDTE